MMVLFPTKQAERKRGAHSVKCFSAALVVISTLLYLSFMMPRAELSSARYFESDSPDDSPEGGEEHGNAESYQAPKHLLSPLMIPQGSTPNLPSIRVSKSVQKTRERDFYGGEGDKPHLGGFTEIDMHGISPSVWKDMVNYFGVKSIMDLGCGRGISTSWFVMHGVEALCIEGSHDAVEKTMLPDPSTQVVEHDFSRGPWWPPEGKTYDAVWCVEFLEHVGRNFHVNYLPVLRKSAIIFASHSVWGGWHHVEVHDDSWWIAKMELYGFKYSHEMTQRVRNIAAEEAGRQDFKFSPTGGPFNAQHVFSTMMVFFNPAVGALPQHAHLLGEDGCSDGINMPRPCGSSSANKEETILPPAFHRLNLTEAMDKAWYLHVKSNLNMTAIDQ